MENNFPWLLLSALVFISVPTNGCTIDGLDWFVAASESILDTFRGNIWNRSTSNIEGIQSIEYTEGLNNGPYVAISHTDSRLIISTNNAFENYEEYETAMSMGFTIIFGCTGGSTIRFVFEVRITDTNNNDPQFRPSNAYEFIIAPPIPPGFLITNCVDDIIVRDIDLTTERIDFEISGSSLFQIVYDNSSTTPKEFKASLRTATFIRSIPEPIILTLTATDVDRTGDPRRTATATIKVLADSEFNFPDEPIFSQTFYLATYTENEFILQEPISLRQGFDEQVVFSFVGQYSQYFDMVPNGNGVTFKIKAPIPVELYKEGHIFLVVKAERTYTSGATATVVVQLPEVIGLTFEAGIYEGSIEDNKLNLDDLKLRQGYEDTIINVDIISDYSSYFTASVNGNMITLSMNPLSDSIIKDNNFINLQVIATTTINSTATTIVTLEIIKDDITTPVFERNLYTGSFDQETGLNLEQIVLIQGYDDTVTVTLEGEYSTLFEKKQDGPYISLSLSSLPSELLTERNILVSVRARKPRTVGANAVVLITLPKGSDIVPDTSVSFDKVLYNGNLKGGIIHHDTIRLSGFTGSDIYITGELANSFEAKAVNGYVTVDVAFSAVFPENLTYIALTLQADTANAVLLLDVMPSDAGLPIVSFGSPSYFLWADINQTGTVGRVTATVDNGESVLYSITVDDDLRDHVSINVQGEILLSISVDRGTYSFKVTATAKTSLVSATAQVILRVDGLPECSTEDGLPPLIILERVEEEPHLNLVVLNQTHNEDCWYTITNLWPEDQSWLYVDNGGLHARAIDREHKSIAFMISSQIQVELILHCDNVDERAIVKRSLGTGTGSQLDLYDYGSNKWVLADTIMYNAKRSVVNLIVEDINDNSPKFIGKENEPIYVGYPIPELENAILPRALIELKATDADIGENAALIYWSSDENLAVAATTGFVHIQNNALVENNSRFTVYAIDQNGKGLNGSLDIVVKLLEKNQIAVITVRNAFLDDENSILSNLSKSVGYDVKVLRTVVISDNNVEIEETSRRKRETTSTSGASLQLFVYGVSGSQLINVEKLMSDLDEVVSAYTVRVTSLENHLEDLECSVSGQYTATALLVATVTLAVVLFILVVVATILWFLRKWRKKQNYENFFDTSSQASRIETDPIPKVESPSKPRLDIEELKRSERRLQEMLDAPLPEITVHPPKNETNKVEEDESIAKVQETLINIAADPQQPIIIQSIDKLKNNTDDSGEDEFGEVTVTTPRKSVVTFNENVEKIIHLEYGIDENLSEPDTEVYRL